MLIRDLSNNELEDLRATKGNERVSESEVDKLIAEIVNRIRIRPDVVQGTSVRGSIAFKEVLFGFGEMQNGLTRRNIEKAALVTLPPRISTKQGTFESAFGIVTNIVREVLYGIRFSEEQTGSVQACKEDRLSPEDMMTILQNLSCTQLPREEKQQRTEKNRIVVVPVQDTCQKPSKYPMSRDLLQKEKGRRESFSRESISDWIEELKRRLEQGGIAGDEYQREKSKLEEIAGAISHLQSQMTSKEWADTVIEFMEAKDKQWQKKLEFEGIYIYYHIKGTCEGKQLIPPKRGWYGLKVIVDYMENRGLVKTSASGRVFDLTGQALDALLEFLLERDNRIGDIKGFTDCRRGQYTERNRDIRNYAVGDVFRDISFRKTLRGIAKDKKKLSDLRRRDFKVFMRQPNKLRSDIAFCLDSSGSMGLQRKLIYARLAAAGLARAALKRGDRVGLVTFDDLGRCSLSLTDNKKDIFDYITNINAGGNTNIGDGIACASELLLHGSSRNQKHIVLITDGISSAISQKVLQQLNSTNEKDLSEQCAIVEAKKASSKGIKISVIHIASGEEAGKELVKNIAKSGRGHVRTINTVDDIRLTVQ